MLNYGYGEIVGGIASLDQRIGRVRSLGTSVDLVKYTYLGTAAAVIVDYVQPDVRLDRTVAYNGSWTTGTYPGWDRFGRPRTIRWVDGAFLNQQASGSMPWIPQLVEYTYEYDKRGNVTKRYDDRRGAGFQGGFDAVHGPADKNECGPLGIRALILYIFQSTL